MNQNLEVKIFLEEGASIPKYADIGASGCDLCANISEPVVIPPHAVKLIPTGLHVEIPYGFEMQVRPRSGKALKCKITSLNTPGTIDCSYRGEVGIIAFNAGDEPYIVKPGEALAQGVFAPWWHANFIQVEKLEDLSPTTRGDGAYGHSGN